MTSSLRTHPARWAGLLSLLIYAVLGTVLLLPRGPPPFPELRLPLSTATAVANGTTFALLLAGWVSIRQGRRRRHRRLMVLAGLSIAAFLVLYVTRQSLVGTLEFQGPDALRTFLYLPLLIPHLVLSAASVPPVLYNFIVGLTRPLDQVARTPHPRVGRIVVPLWLVSSSLGLVVFLLLLLYATGGTP